MTPHLMNIHFLLSVLTLADLMRWLYYEVWGNADSPGTVADCENRAMNHENFRPECRSNIIKYWKKVLSFLMPNRLIPWNQLAGVGNPTRCTQINDMIRSLKRLGVRGKGAPAQARRSCTKEEFLAARAMCKEHSAQNFSACMMCD